MNRDRLQQLEEVAALLRLRLQDAQMRAALLRRDLDLAQRNRDIADAQREEIEAGWRRSLSDGAGLDLNSISAWRAMATTAQSRCTAAEQSLRQARETLDAFGRELSRHQSLSERGDESAERERTVLARKHDDKTSNAILERHNAMGVQA
ncbi:MAG: hypothetical protein ACREP7_09510 [Lysobacter sp.]